MMSSDYMRAFRPESTTAVSTSFSPLSIFVQHEFCYFPQDITENAFADTAHAPCHVTYA